ncbi:unnamed protein product [marine sediment metagenome]|uniref:Uncharacterized protein n=1 Tax=marine sediment metagenome TaxID=412755 RepID=X1D3E6_9ZZZZ
MLQDIIAKCREEIRWAQACLDELEKGIKYCDDDKIWLPCWLKAHKQILEIALREPYVKAGENDG